MKRFIFFILFSSICLFSSNQVYTESIENYHLTVIPLQSTGIVNVRASDKMDLEITHELRGEELYIECFINGFLFSEEKAGMQHIEGEGHLRLYVDGNHIDTIYQPAFIVKGLEKGEHDIQVVLVKNDRSLYELEETFQIKI
ncbi:hypothetical protein GN156_01650 [bacterium LRH843]|nr:hypothetical protein [bacterium LRH843]